MNALLEKVYQLREGRYIHDIEVSDILEAWQSVEATDEENEDDFDE